MAASTQTALPDRGPRSQILSPLVRRLASEHGVDLGQVSGTGTGGRITKNDVLGFVAAHGEAAPVTSTPSPAAQPAQPAPAAAPAALPAQPAPTAAPATTPAQASPAVVGGGEEIVPVSHIRRTIAQHMKASLEISARAWNAVEVNMENVARVRERTKDAFKAREGFGLTYMPFVTRAVTEALLAHPMVNSELRGDEIAVKHFVNMGIAVSYDEGLIVPILKGSDTMNLLGIARGINDLATRARAKKLLPDEVHGGTFTITNPGPFGSLISVPIINQPQTGILGFDTVEKRPVVIDDTIAIRHMVYISMSWDHRDRRRAASQSSRWPKDLETGTSPRTCALARWHAIAPSVSSNTRRERPDARAAPPPSPFKPTSLILLGIRRLHRRRSCGPTKSCGPGTDRRRRGRATVHRSRRLAHFHGPGHSGLPGA